MKIKTLLVTSALLAGSYCGSASAEGLYAGGGVGMQDMSIDPTISTQEDGFNIVYGRVGKQFNEYIAGELRLAFGSGSADFDSGDPAMPYYEYDFDKMGGVYFKFGAPVTESIYPYFLFGYSRAEYKVTLVDSGDTVDSSQEGVSWGLGLDYNLSDSLAASIEYTEYQDENYGIDNAGVSVTRIKGLSLSLVMSF